CGSHRGRPCPLKVLWCISQTDLHPESRATPEILPMSFLLLDNLFQLCGHVRNPLSQYLHLTARTAANDNVHFTEGFDLVRIIFAKMAAAAFFSFNGGASDRFGYG